MFICQTTGALLLSQNLPSYPVQIHIIRRFVGLVISGLVIITLVNGPQITDLSGMVWLAMTARLFCNALLVSLTGMKGRKEGKGWMRPADFELNEFKPFSVSQAKFLRLSNYTHPWLYQWSSTRITPTIPDRAGNKWLLLLPLLLKRFESLPSSTE